MSTAQGFYFVCLLGIVVLQTLARPTAVTVVFYSSTGLYNVGINDGYMAKYWKNQLAAKVADPSFAVNSIVELVDNRSNVTLMRQWTVARMANTSLPPVSMFVFTVQGLDQMKWFSQFKVPCYLCAWPANVFNQNVNQGPDFQYAFFAQPPIQTRFLNLLKTYQQAGVKTFVTIIDYAVSTYTQVLYRDDGSLYNSDQDACNYGASEVFVPNGLEQLGSFSYSTQTATYQDRVNLIRELQKIQPDAILLCDSAAQLYKTSFEGNWLVSVMKDLNYLPKALNFLGHLGGPLANYWVPTGLYDYLTTPTFSHPDFSGIDYTERNVPYNGYFLNDYPTTAAEQIIAGSNIGNHSSSTRLFSYWYKNLFGRLPSFYSTSVWAGFEVAEAAMWKASQNPEFSADNVISASEMLTIVSQTNIPSPFGRIIFDPISQANTANRGAIVQVFNGNPIADIVSPATISTTEFVYPMPNWDERSYKFSLITKEVNQAIPMAAVASAVLVALMITAAVYSGDEDFKSLDSSHMILLLSCCLLVFWSMVFVWQDDVNQTQCDCLLWTIFLPASFVLQLVNVKAFRLTVFLTSDDKSKLKLFTHVKTFSLAVAWTSFTVVLLLIAALVDPLTTTTVVTDIHRPSKNYHYCDSGPVTYGILFFLVAFHMLVSFVCVFYVRNGSRAYKDGRAMKEAFLVVYSFIITTLVLSTWGLSNSANYLVRVAFIGFGFMLFSVRLLLSRCWERWIPKRAVAIASQVYHQIEFATIGLAKDGTSYVLRAESEDLIPSSHADEQIEIFDPEVVDV